MGRIEEILVRKKLIGITPKRLQRWQRESNLEILSLVALGGACKERQAAVRSLASLAHKEVIPVLREVLSDKVKDVAFAAIEVLHQIGKARYLTDEIEATKLYWEERERKVRRNWEVGTCTSEKLIDKSQMVRFSQFKRQVLAKMHRGRFY